jgi:hypothetical protein
MRSTTPPFSTGLKQNLTTVFWVGRSSGAAAMGWEEDQLVGETTWAVFCA